MAAKPWAASHVAAVASAFSDLRISAAVKDELVTLLVAKLDEIVPRMESDTLAEDAARKTLDDPHRTRLGFNRTKGLMTERIDRVESVGAAAVSAACEELESYLLEVLRACETVCTNHQIGTIKPRHLTEALQNLGGSTGVTVDLPHPSSNSVGDDDPLKSLLGGVGVMTPALMRNMVKQFAGMKVDNDAIEELLEVYYEEAAKLQHELKNSVIGGNPAEFIPTLKRLDSLAQMGWLKSNLKDIGAKAAASGSRTVRIEYVVDHDFD